jgi:hypothetical protein
LKIQDGCRKQDGVEDLYLVSSNFGFFSRINGEKNQQKTKTTIHLIFMNEFLEIPKNKQQYFFSAQFEHAAILYFYRF